MFMGYCFDSRGYHTPGTKLTTPGEAFKYCVMHVVDHELRIPVSDGPDALFRIIDLSASSTCEQLLHFIEEQSSGTE